MSTNSHRRRDLRRALLDGVVEARLETAMRWFVGTGRARQRS